MVNRRRLIAAACSAVALGLSTSAALAAGYASGVSGGTYILNENNSTVTIVTNGVAGTPTVLNAGTQSFTPGAGTYSIVVSNNPGAGYLGINSVTAGAAGIRDGTLVGTPLQISDDNNTRNSFNAPRCIAVNTNPANGSLFGRVYVGNSADGTTAGFPTPSRTLTDGIFINDAAGGDPTGQVDAALTGGLDFATGGTSSPWRLALDESGALYIGDWSDAAGSVYRTDANVTAGGNLLVGQGATTFINPTTTLNHGSVAALFVTGSAAAGNLTLYTLDEDLTPTDPAMADKLNSLWRYDLGTATSGFSGLPTVLASDILIDNLATGGLVVNAARGKDGKVYIAQNRTDGSEVGIAVLAPDGVTKIYDSLADSQYLNLDGNPGVDLVQDVLRTTQGVAISPDNRYMAQMRNNSDIMIVPLLDGIPDLANAILLDTFDNVASGRNIAFDAADNVYVVSSGNQAMRVFSPGGPTQTTYNSNGTFQARIGADFNGSGNYSDTSKWLLGIVPNAVDEQAIIGNLSSGSQTLTLDGAGSVQLAFLRFAGGDYTVGGTASLNMGAGFAEPRIIAEAGNHTVNAAVNVNKNLGVSANAGASLTLTNVSYAATTLNLTKFGAGRVQMPAAEFNNVDVRFGTLALPPSGAPAALKTKTMRIAGSGGTFSATLDLGRGGGIVDHDGTAPADVVAAIIAGRAGGTWTGQGITSSLAAASSSTTAVGYGETADLGITNFLGTPVDSTATVFRFTRLGDANLDGTTNIGDFSLLAANFNTAGAWIKGDFNYDGSVNIGDFSLLAANFNQGLPADASRGAVPEPTVLSAIGAAMFGLSRRRRN